MVKINSIRKVETEDSSFIALDLVGDPEVVISKITGKPYLTAMRASMTCTFSEEVAQKLVGQTLPGRIEKIAAAEPYDWTNPQTGEVMVLNHNYAYVPEETAEEAVFER
jgi:hypothetical protein